MEGLQKPLSKFNIGQTNAKNKGNAYRTHVVSTTRSGTTKCIDWGS